MATVSHRALLRVAAALGICAVAAAAIDWQTFLERHDPVWRWNVTSTVGYTQYNVTIGEGSGAGCSAVPCTSNDTAVCIDEFASQCDACATCASFGLSPAWNNGQLPQLYGQSAQLVPNSKWTTFAKGGPVLRNHSSSTAPLAAVRWEDGPWIGNGLLGALVTVIPSDPGRQLLVQLGRSDVWDRRGNGSQYSVDSMLWDRPRLPTAHMLLQTTGVIVSGEMRMYVANASLQVSLNTTAGAVDMLMYAHAGLDAIVGRVYTSGAEVLNWTLVPEVAASTRNRDPPVGYLPNPAPSCAPVPGAGTVSVLCVQQLLAGGNHAYGFASGMCAGGVSLCNDMIITLANDWPANSSGITAQTSLLTLMSALSTNASFAPALAVAHSAWWLEFWQSGAFVTVPNTTLEGLWYLQMLKYGSVIKSGSGFPVMDLMGPWFQRTSWPAVWLDLNLQLQYWALPAANRFSLMQGLVDYLYNHLDALAANAGEWSADSYAIGGAAAYDAEAGAAPPSIVGDLPWLMHNLYTFARHSLNDTLMVQVVFPILSRVANFYSHLLFNGSDGLLHMVATSSPEYPYPNGPTNDTNYDLALLRWSCVTLLSIDAAYGLNASGTGMWTAILQQLTPYPTDNDGLMISDGVPFAIPHRHFSHAFAIYPLHLETWDVSDGGTPASRSLIQRTLDHWAGLTCGGGACPNGFTFDGAASMSALMTDDAARRGAAVGNLTRFIASGLIHSSTMYSEGSNPCIESPLAAANSLQEILLQSWGGRVRVFPAVPPAWPDAAFANMSAEGGFLLSAARSGGATAFVTVTAPPRDGHSAPRAVVLVTDMPQPLDTLPAGVPLNVLPNGDVAFNITVGSSVTLFPRGTTPNITVSPLPGDPSEYNFWGRK